MAGELTRTPNAPPPAIIVPTGPTGPIGGGLRTGGTEVVPVIPGTTRERVDQFPGAITTPTAGLPGSSLDTLYGINSGTYLTPEQRTLARQIQGKFDASVNSRDRALTQYGAPRLSSFMEDEALARAMSLAGGLNYRAPVPLTGLPNTRAGGVPGGGTRYTPPPITTTPTGPSSGAQNNAQWQRILSGLASIVPLLFGKDAYGQFLNKGLIQSVKETLFGPGSQISDQQLQQVITQGGLPSEGPITYNPITGEPMVINPNFTPGGLGDPWGPGSGWGLDVPQPADWWTAPDTSAFDLGNGWDFGALAGP